MKKKLRQQKAETLIEALVSLLIAMLSIGLLCSAMVASANINRMTDEADKKFDEELKYAEMRISDEEHPIQGSTLLIEYTSLENQNIDVNIYGGEESSLISYEEAEVDEP